MTRRKKAKGQEYQDLPRAAEDEARKNSERNRNYLKGKNRLKGWSYQSGQKTGERRGGGGKKAGKDGRGSGKERFLLNGDKNAHHLQPVSQQKWRKKTEIGLGGSGKEKGGNTACQKKEEEPPLHSPRGRTKVVRKEVKEGEGRIKSRQERRKSYGTALISRQINTRERKKKRKKFQLKLVNPPLSNAATLLF